MNGTFTYRVAHCLIKKNNVLKVDENITNAKNEAAHFSPKSIRHNDVSLIVMGYAINPVIDLFFQQGQSLRSALQAVVGAEELQHKPSGVYIQA